MISLSHMHNICVDKLKPKNKKKNPKKIENQEYKDYLFPIIFLL